MGECDWSDAWWSSLSLLLSRRDLGERDGGDVVYLRVPVLVRGGDLGQSHRRILDGIGMPRVLSDRDEHPTCDRGCIGG